VFCHFIQKRGTTKKFLVGFYCNFGLDLFSTVGFTISTKKVNTPEKILPHLEEGSDREEDAFFDPQFIRLAVSNIQQHLPQGNPQGIQEIV